MKKLLLLSLLLSQLAFGKWPGLIVPKDWQEKGPWVESFRGVEIPEAFDWREKLQNPIKNQRSCGSCWAFATTGIFEYAILKETGVLVDLAEQEMVSCVKSSYGCGGGYFDHDYQVNPGQAFEKDFPYTATNGRCKKVEHPYKLLDWAYVGQKGKKPTVDQLKEALVAQGPIAVTVAANNAMSGYKGGVFKGCTNMQTNHMVILVGWTKEGQWIMRNSWGVNWGDKGYMLIPFGCSRIGEVASAVVYKAPTLDLEVFGLPHVDTE